MMETLLPVLLAIIIGGLGTVAWRGVQRAHESHREDRDRDRKRLDKLESRVDELEKR